MSPPAARRDRHPEPNLEDRRLRGEPCASFFAAGWRSWTAVCAGLDGNGRSCADCHMPTDHFQLSPASAETAIPAAPVCVRRFNPDADDPLFRPIDADDFRTNG